MQKQNRIIEIEWPLYLFFFLRVFLSLSLSLSSLSFSLSLFPFRNYSLFFISYTISLLDLLSAVRRKIKARLYCMFKNSWSIFLVTFSFKIAKPSWTYSTKRRTLLLALIPQKSLDFTTLFSFMIILFCCQLVLIATQAGH